MGDAYDFEKLVSMYMQTQGSEAFYVIGKVLKAVPAPRDIGGLWS